MADHSNFQFDFSGPSLQGRVVLIAGGSGGLGSAAAALLARDGARVIIGYRRNRGRAEGLQKALKQQFQTTVEIVAGDIIEAGARSDYLEAARRIGPLYGLICFTGDPGRVRFEEATEDDLRKSLDQNYIGPLLLARDAIQSMHAARQSGAVVLTSTMQAVAAFEGSYNYAGPKVALLHAARIMAKQYGGQEGIRVNVIAPGVNRAGMALTSIQSGKYDRFVEEGIIPRFGKAEDVARVVRLLIEPDNYLTGQVITIDGGLTLRR